MVLEVDIGQGANNLPAEWIISVDGWFSSKLTLRD
jgi:hypothetical protein